MNYCYTVISSSGLVAAILNLQSTTSGSVDSSISESGMAENIGVEVEIAAPSVTGQKLFPLPVFAGRHLEF